MSLSQDSLGTKERNVRTGSQTTQDRGQILHHTHRQRRKAFGIQRHQKTRAGGELCVGELSGDGLMKWCLAARVLLNEIMQAYESNRRPARGNETDWPAHRKISGKVRYRKWKNEIRAEDTGCLY
jgi:hypothetical protein